MFEYVMIDEYLSPNFPPQCHTSALNWGQGTCARYCLRNLQHLHAFTCKRFAHTLLRHPLSELLPLQHFEFEPHRLICLHQVGPLCLHAQQIKLEKRLKRIIKTFENDQKDSAEASVAGSVVELKAWQQAQAFEA